jgi:hypothetical protein
MNWLWRLMYDYLIRMGMLIDMMKGSTILFKNPKCKICRLQ